MKSFITYCNLWLLQKSYGCLQCTPVPSHQLLQPINYISLPQTQQNPTVNLTNSPFTPTKHFCRQERYRQKTGQTEVLNRRQDPQVPRVASRAQRTIPHAKIHAGLLILLKKDITQKKITESSRFRKTSKIIKSKH